MLGRRESADRRSEKTEWRMKVMIFCSINSYWEIGTGMSHGVYSSLVATLDGHLLSMGWSV